MSPDPGTRSSRRRKPLPRSLSGIVLILLTLAGFIASVPVLLRPGVPRDTSFLRGEWTAGFEDQLGSRLVGREALTAARGLLRYLLLGEGEPGVEVGAGGWLFSSEEFANGADWQFSSAELLQTMASLEASLPADASLVIVPLPAKWRVSPPESLTPRLRRMIGRGRQERLGELTNLLRTNAFERTLVVAVDGALSEAGSFFRRDTHWTPGGTNAVAQAIRGSLEAGGLPADFGAEVNASRSSSTEQIDGDLLSFLPFPGLHARLGLGPEPYTPPEVTVEAQSLGLFDDPSVPVLLVGTSYSADPRFGFDAALKQALAGDLVNFAQEGGGPLGPVEAMIAAGGPEQWQPQLAIWEIPERYWDPGH